MSTPLRVLLIDDSEDDATLLLRALRRGGYALEALRVETEEAMIAALEERPFDIVLSDHEMPAFNALGALSVRNARVPDLPFIVVSGRISEDVIVAIMKNGAQDYVLKRDLGRVASAVDRALREAAALAESKRAEAALRESEARYALAVRGSRDGLWDWNIATNAAYYAPRVREMLGYEEHELANDVAAFMALVHPDDVPRVTASIEAHLRDRTPYSMEFRVRSKQGEYLWIHSRAQALWDETGRPIRMAGSLTDLTERKRAEAELRDKLEIIQRQLEIIQQQKEDIRVLSTPIIEVWSGVLMTPVHGSLDRERATAMMDAVLQAVVRTRSRQVIVDLTGVASLDPDTADHVVRLIHAVGLLGARGIVVGIRPEVASAIVSADIDLSRVRTLANLREALLLCMRATS